MNDAMKLAAGDYVTEVSVLSSCVTLVISSWKFDPNYTHTIFASCFPDSDA